MDARFIVLFVSTLGLASCTEHDAEIGRVGGPIPVYEAGSVYECNVDGGIDATCELPPADTPGAQIPCGPADVLGPLDGPVEDRRCHRCHVDPQENGAPFPLLTWSDTQQMAGTKPIWQRMYKAVCTDYMPFCNGGKCGTFDPIVKPLTPQQKSTLLEWLACPQPVFDTTCQ